jgi:hypothetical protein
MDLFLGNRHSVFGGFICLYVGQDIIQGGCRIKKYVSYAGEEAAGILAFDFLPEKEMALTAVRAVSANSGRCCKTC